MINKIPAVVDFLFDSKDCLRFNNLVESKPVSHSTNSKLLVVNDYISYPDVRHKAYRQFSFRCDRNDIINLLAASSSYRIVALSTPIHQDYSSDRTQELHYLIEKYEPVCDLLICTNNVGRDIGSYYAALISASLIYEGWSSCVLMNTSQFYSVETLRELIARPNLADSLEGISYGVGPVFLPLKRLHVQSFFLKSTFSSLLTIFNLLYPSRTFYSSKYSDILRGEIAISSCALSLGLNLVQLFPGNSFARLVPKISFSSYDDRQRLVDK